MNRIILLLCVAFLFSCKSKETKPPEPPPPMVEVTGKLEKLLSFPKDSVLESYDLSGDFIMDFPDLSAYTIKSLNLSHNYIDTIIVGFWPKGIEVLDLSYNYVMGYSEIYCPTQKPKELNLSHNYINYFIAFTRIDSLDLSYNNLNKVFYYWSYQYHYGFWEKKGGDVNVSYLNISNNPHLSNEVWLVPSMIDTIIRDNIANDKELQMIDWLLRKMRGLREAED